MNVRMYMSMCMHATMSIVGTVIGPPVSASYSLRILHHMGPTFTSITPAVSTHSLGFMHLIVTACQFPNYSVITT